MVLVWRPPVTVAADSGGAVSDFSAIRRPHSASVQEDWAAWLPDETARIFDAMRTELAVSSVVLGAILDQALSDGQGDGSAPPPQLALVFSGLFDRLACRLDAVLRALEEHGRHCGTLPSAAPLRPEYFRSERARQVARANQLLSRLLYRGRAVFSHKLGALHEVLAGLQRQARNVANKIALGESSSARARWSRLEVLQYDLNTCLQETTVVLKSFFCALPGNELQLFRDRLMV